MGLNLPPIDRAEGRRLFGDDPARYDRARPGHPRELYEILRERCSVGPGAAVLEVGPGTGQATRRLLELGAARLVAVEPDAALAAYLASVTDEQVEVVVAPLEEADLAADSFDVAAAASSFHWIDEDLGFTAIFRALRPAGWIAVWWTLFGDDERRDPFSDAVDPVMRELAPSPSQGRRGGPQHGLDPARAVALGRAGFEPARHDVIRWSHSWNARGIRDLFATFSGVARVPEPRRTAVLDEIERIARDGFGGRVEKPLVTSLYTARKPG